MHKSQREARLGRHQFSRLAWSPCALILPVAPPTQTDTPINASGTRLAGMRRLGRSVVALVCCLLLLAACQAADDKQGAAAGDQAGQKGDQAEVRACPAGVCLLPAVPCCCCDQEPRRGSLKRSRQPRALPLPPRPTRRRSRPRLRPAAAAPQCTRPAAPHMQKKALTRKERDELLKKKLALVVAAVKQNRTDTSKVEVQVRGGGPPLVVSVVKAVRLFIIS